MVDTEANSSGPVNVGGGLLCWDNGSGKSIFVFV